MENLLDWLQKWYLAQCDGDWEHQYGIKIDTLDNPGWTVLIDLNGTSCEDEPFKEIDIQKSELDWIQCNVTNNQFQGAGSPNNLIEILAVFRNWAESPQ